MGLQCGDRRVGRRDTVRTSSRGRVGLMARSGKATDRTPMPASFERREIISLSLGERVRVRGAATPLRGRAFPSPALRATSPKGRGEDLIGQQPA